MKKIYQTDPYLEPFKNKIESRHKAIEELAKRFAAGGSIASVMNNHLYYGMHRMGDGSWVFREWAPNANRIYLIGEFNNWKRVAAYQLHPIGGGNWEICLPSMFLHHGEL